MMQGTRRGVMLGGAAALAAGSRAFAAEGTAVYAGGPILTMDDARPRAQAVAVRGGRILAVGDRDEVLAKAGRGARLVDLDGRALLPGFVDPHGHVSFVGLQAVSANLLPASTARETRSQTCSGSCGPGATPTGRSPSAMA